MKYFLKLLILLLFIDLNGFGQNVLIQPEKITTEDLETWLQKQYDFVFGHMNQYIEEAPIDKGFIPLYSSFTGNNNPASLYLNNTILTPNNSKVVGFDVLEEINHLTRAAVVVKTAINADPASLVGKSGQLRLNGLSSSSRVFGGIITMIQHLGQFDGENYYLVIIHPESYGLSISERFAIHQDSNVPDIVNNIYTSFGLGTPVFHLSGSGTVKCMRVQYGETDLDFITRSAVKEGIWYFVEPNSLSPSLIFEDSNTGLINLGTLNYYGPQENLETAGQQKIFFAGEGNSFAAGKHIVGQYSDQNGSFYSNTALSGISNNYQSYRLEDVYTGTSDLAGKAINNKDAELHKAHKWNALSNAMAVTPGRLFTLNDTQNQISGDYLITKTHHCGFISERGSSDSFYYANQLGFAKSSNPFKVAPKELEYKVNDITFGTIAGPAGETRYVDEWGRVKVDFHWDSNSSGDETSSGWIPVLRPAHGNNSSFFFIPEVGDEVLVNFINGDPDRPIVIGSVPNTNDLPFLSLPSNKTTDYIRTATGAGEASEIRIQNLPNSEKITLKSRDISLHAIDEISFDAEAFAKAELDTNVNSYGGVYADNQITAWGVIRASGTAYNSFGIKTLSKLGTGIYRVITDVSVPQTSQAINVTPEIDEAPLGLTEMVIPSVNVNGTGTFEIYLNDGNGNLVDNDFLFIATGRQ
ncbi:type VI secretion system Vgr family protein [Jiulongibacter sediminis]|uniref:Gp5/Type VI secretion system Vgr protein OB-fold domain-containing protein n=1 Tax=Jiulongibacter sediminis TaxID=1605367 RepID=A0A0P7BUE9_9BACT|nr:type VI secretion system tip protein TssI/VgrG [Jiulongibacter sediminis]KPM48383.1 hypothetical protein AFM12_06985 [Jiulongibacter sediminis]TBX24921.1 hypothetical protein TK44_06990 [Jiulongibacter sediminis]